ncbi:estradiol 17-beta-dehydrogenase 2-like [Xenopus laevis]|uniref:Estradiol 17-beta-dehydrogenase 2-like n=1 Tax=Xenopus laevis TaxID=8355 RepID=A0A8J1N074_XENLA|nr:estradiol 17-beta-dehydrogenase 2-like [Xenopus laevis]
MTWRGYDGDRIQYFSPSNYVEDISMNASETIANQGSDSGFGHALAKHLDELGVHVFAGELDKKGPGAKELKRVYSSHLCLIQLNITNSEEIREAYKEISSYVQNAGPWGVVHNAGLLGYVADGEIIPFSVYKQCMDVHFIGAVQVTKAFVPLLRIAKGRLVSISSMGQTIDLTLGLHFTAVCSRDIKPDAGTPFILICVLGINITEFLPGAQKASSQLKQEQEQQQGIDSK